MKTSRLYNEAFWNTIRSRNEADASISIREGEDGAGNYVMPEEFHDDFNEALKKDNLFRRFSTVIETSPTNARLETITSTGMAAWMSEGGGIPESDDAFQMLTITPHRLSSLTRLNNSFIRDIRLDLGKYLSGEFARRFGRAEERGFIAGDGVTQPYGILHPTQGAQVGVTAASATEIAFDEVKKLYFSLKPEYRRNAVWIMSDETAFYLRTLKDADGAYLWRDTDDTIFGRPVEVSPYMPDMAAGAMPIVLADLHYYWVAQRQPLTVRILREAFAEFGQTGIIAYENLDARLILPEAGKILQMAE